MKSISTSREIVLASSSPYRSQLLAKLNINFHTAHPNIDETLICTNHPEQQAMRLAQLKAEALKSRFNHHLIIGSDQIVILNQQQLKKPGNRRTAIEHLSESSGKVVKFYTAICVVDSENNRIATSYDRSVVHFRTLNEAQIIRYVDQERPFDCAGALKVEGLGIALLKKIDCEDPNSLIGLPLIKLCALLERFSVSIP